MLPRVYHFILTDQHNKRAEEIELLFSDLKRRTPRLPDIYIVEALLSLKTKDYARTTNAIAQAELWLPKQDPELQKFQRLKVDALKQELARRSGQALP